MKKIIIHPHHCSREKYNELIQYLNDNLWNYKQKEDEELETRICSKCGIEKPLTDFTKDKRKKLGIRGVCKNVVVKEYAIMQKQKNVKKFVKNIIKQTHILLTEKDMKKRIEIN